VRIKDPEKYKIILRRESESQHFERGENIEYRVHNEDNILVE